MSIVNKRSLKFLSSFSWALPLFLYFVYGPCITVAYERNVEFWIGFILVLLPVLLVISLMWREIWDDKKNE